MNLRTLNMKGYSYWPADSRKEPVVLSVGKSCCTIYRILLGMISSRRSCEEGDDSVNHCATRHMVVVVWKAHLMQLLHRSWLRVHFVSRWS